MISDEKLARISLLIAVLGIAMIYISIAFIGPHSLQVKDIRESDAGKQVSLNGTISTISESDGNIFIDLQDGTGVVLVVMFERTARSQKDVYELEEGDKIVVQGQVNVYKNALEIIANTISRTP